MSFTEFSYQLVQGYDFLTLYRDRGCKLQIGGSDQWGNMTTGTELIRRTLDGEAYALTCNLITKADGTKFGKTEGGNVWLDRNRTSPYKFYQFWLNVADNDAEKYIKIFTTLTREEIDSLIEEHRQDPGRRVLQRRLAEEITTMVHSAEDLRAAQEASQILFSNNTAEALHRLDEATLLDVFDGVPRFEVERADIEAGIRLADLLTDKAAVFPSKGEMRKLVQGGGVSINKEKITDPQAVATTDMLLADRYIIVQKGKKNYFLLIVK